MFYYIHRVVEIVPFFFKTLFCSFVGEEYYLRGQQERNPTYWFVLKMPSIAGARPCLSQELYSGFRCGWQEARYKDSHPCLPGTSVGCCIKSRVPGTPVQYVGVPSVPHAALFSNFKDVFIFTGYADSQGRRNKKLFHPLLPSPNGRKGRAESV